MAGPKKKQLKRIIIVEEVDFDQIPSPTKLTKYLFKIKSNKNKKLHDKNTIHFNGSRLVKT